MKVIVIPTNRDVIRIDHDDAIFSTEKGKFLTIADEIAEIHATGQPVLVGTISIEKSELLSDMLKKRGIRHNVLNAKHHEQEAKIVAEAGRLDAVTIATNMAGRGTDIILGGNPEFEAKKDMIKDGYDEETISYASSLIPLDDPELIAAREKFIELHTKYKTERAEEQENVIALGGLFIIGTERHESRRIDNQLRGRSGRQGDPGATRFFISMEDELLRLFGGERMQTMIERLGVQEGEAIEANMLSKSIENAQKRVESRNFAARKYVLQYDNVMNKQREIIYGERRQVLLGDDMKENILSMLAELVKETVDGAVMGSQYSEEWDFEYLDQNLAGMTRAYRGLNLTDEELKRMDSDDLYEVAHEKILELYAAREEEIGADKMRDLERTILLMVIDNKWMDHIDAMDQLRHGIGLRAIGQVDPANAYAQEGFDMFELMEASIKEEVVKYCLGVRAETRDERRSATVALREKKQEEESGFASALAAGGAGGGSGSGESTSGAMPGKTPEESRDGRHTPVKRDQPKVGRNDPCPCGSGKKYKNCCGKGA
jgi:preprotein translocase subunit SecA